MGWFAKLKEWLKGRKSAPSPQSEDRLSELEAGFRLAFRRRLEAGVPMTAEEWAEWDHDDAGVFIQNLWLDEREQYERERRAVEAQFFASAIRGNILNEEAVFDRLPAEGQTQIMRQRAYVAAQIRKAHRGGA